MEAGDVTLMRGDLRSVAEAIELSLRTLRIIRQNLFWAFAYKHDRYSGGGIGTAPANVGIGGHGAIERDGGNK